MNAPDWLRAALEQVGEQACRERWGRRRMLGGSSLRPYQAQQLCRLIREAGYDLAVARARLDRRPSPSPVDAPELDELQISQWREPERAPLGPGWSVEAIPEDDEAEEPIGEAIERQCQRYRRARARAATIGPRVIRLQDGGPIGIVHFGDPHVDDDGCNWPALRRAVEVVSQTPHLYAGNVGDTVNNWVGRLVAKYAHQGATEEEGWRYARWLMQACPWLYVVGGNHDQWRGGMSMLRLLTEGAQIGLMAPDECRLELQWPGGGSFRLHVRHDFKGSSIYNKTHGLNRAVLWGQGWGDLYVCGHRHEWGEQHTEYEDGRVRWLLRVRGFKHFDEYARSKQFYDHQYGQTVTTIIDPDAHPADRVRVVVDVEEAAEMLAWLRRRRAA